MSRTIIITGGSSGLGAAISRAIKAADGEDVSIFTIDRHHGHDVARPAANWPNPPRVDILINCAGINDIDYIEDFELRRFYEVMAVNAGGIFATVQHYMQKLEVSKGTILNIVSNASHVPMTASTAYNASKGAAHIMTLQMARELGKRKGITVFGISPNKLRGTTMSRTIEDRVQRVRGWTAEEAEAYQLAALPAGEETDPATLAEFIAFLLSTKQRHKYLAGCVIPYGA